MNKRAVALFSGGLDSMLAVRLMLEQQIELHALHFSSIFCNSGFNHRDLEVPIKVLDITEEFTAIVKNPQYGRGSNMNPCIDCRIFSFKKAKYFMQDIGASFIVTGEVVGERPMSQTKQAISLIEKKSGMEGLVVRPLCAKLLKPSMPEQLGIVNRDLLLDMQGRRRERQFSLAEKFGITGYPTPAGGCLLTDKAFSNRLKDLLRHNEDCGLNNLELLKIGRQFRINESTKLFVGRNETENNKLLSFARAGDLVFDVVGIPGPIGLVRGRIGREEIGLVSSIVARYSDAEIHNVEVSYKILPSKELESITVQPAIESLLSSLRI